MAEEAGAGIRLGTALDGLDAENRIARVRDGVNWRVIRYRHLIAADGPHSKVAALLGMPRQDLVHTRQYTVPLLTAQADTSVWLSGEYPGGYAWLFPRGGDANLGIGIDYEFGRNAKHPLDKLHEQLVQTGTLGPTILRRTGGAIPVGGLREQLVGKSTIFVGDAAGLAHPITGAGIAAAVVSGERAGQAIVEWLASGSSAALDAYEQAMRDLYGPSIERALRVRKSLASVWRSHDTDRKDAQHRIWIAFDEFFGNRIPVSGEAP
jgi:flavin-dependent dehydrogenase